MKTVRIFAANVKVGDVLVGPKANQRIQAVHKYVRRCRRNGDVHKLAHTGVLIIAPNPSGNDLDVFDAYGDDKIIVKRPNYNKGT